MCDHTTQMLYARGYDQAKRGDFDSAASLYACSRRHARRGRFWSARSRDSHRLLDLSHVGDTCCIEQRSYAGLQAVPIKQIRGSEGRSSDFDRDFRPLQDHCKARWLGIARARERDKVLPPAVLVQIGELYFVRDGHHRISVARAMGQLDIDAEVTVWHVRGPLPWKRTEGEEARALVGQRTLGGGRGRAPILGQVTLWLRSRLPWRSPITEMAPAHSSAAG